MKFNRRNRYSFIELASETNIPERELKRSLMALALGRCSQRILCKEPKTRDIESTDIFYVNDSFVSKHIKVRVCLNYIYIICMVYFLKTYYH